ncbi:MAG: hypothetical protein KDD61_02975 [Bdellovibrionales bacterium]|nr:hypothetical protein [Bdellovibrionales bacterium]
MISNEIVKSYVDSNANFINHNERIFDIIEGDLLDKIKAKLQKIIRSPRAYQNTIELIPPINILRQINNKLSTIYVEPPERSAENSKDQFLIEYYESEADINNVFHEANRFFNSQKVAAIDPFVENGDARLRALSGHQFLVYSDDVVNKTKVTDFIKFIGKVGDEEIFFIYSNDSFSAVNQYGQIKSEYLDGNMGENPFGIIPQTYIKKSRNLLIPKIDSDIYDMSLLLPIMWASINYGINYQAHSVMYGIDVDDKNIEMNPDTFLSFKSDPNSNTKPEIGFMKPQIEIEAVDNHILDLFNAWLESMNIRPGEATGGSASSLSGVALAIKEMDTTLNRKSQISYFKDFEADFWYRQSKVHNYWVDTGRIKNIPKFSEGFKPTIIFPEISVSEDADAVVSREEKKYKSGLTTLKKALEAIHKGLDEKEIDQLILDIKNENTIEIPALNEQGIKENQNLI